jgi:hypothetical protein
MRNHFQLNHEQQIVIRHHWAKQVGLKQTAKIEKTKVNLRQKFQDDIHVYVLVVNFHALIFHEHDELVVNDIEEEEEEDDDKTHDVTIEFFLENVYEIHDWI